MRQDEAREHDTIIYKECTCVILAALRDMIINVGTPDGGVSYYAATIAIRDSMLEDTSFGETSFDFYNDFALDQRPVAPRRTSGKMIA